ncbi:DUF1129 domain-containing protein [Lacticaseibacillus paracasei]|uniref:DUF1129 domain-containing protein n=1 Tax=Lacticaseibacillus paracasei TaxID=1597 RepID=UPI0021A493F6|nr:DUF1129 domain-containing protein [Lacticaseibacillus paracasei]MCT2892484.1 DUF1129 domain-containing protein [Lacticaseibacillus paracasei]
MAEKHEAETKQTATDAAVTGKNTATTEQTASKVQSAATDESSADQATAAKNAHVKQEKPATTVPELIARLTNKNDEYIFKLRRELKDGGMNSADEEELLKTMLPEIITAQRQGKPANQLYGPVTVKADEILHTPKPEPKKPMWLMVIDQSLFFMSILAVMYGALAYFDTKSQNAASSSFVYLVMLSLMAGLFFVYYADWMQQDKKKRRSAWLVLGGGVVLVVLITFIGSALAMLDTPFTRPMPWFVNIIIGAIAYGIHWVLQHRYHLKSFFQR